MLKFCRLNRSNPWTRFADTPISSPADYIDLDGRLIRADHVNVIGHGLSMGVPHEAYAATGAVCTAAAALLPGTLVQEALSAVFSWLRLSAGCTSASRRCTERCTASDCRTKKLMLASERNIPRVQAERLHDRDLSAALDLRRVKFIDESGINLAMTRLYGRAPRASACWAAPRGTTGRMSPS